MAHGTTFQPTYDTIGNPLNIMTSHFCYYQEALLSECQLLAALSGQRVKFPKYDRLVVAWKGKGLECFGIRRASLTPWHMVQHSSPHMTQLGIPLAGQDGRRMSSYWQPCRARGCPVWQHHRPTLPPATPGGARWPLLAPGGHSGPWPGVLQPPPPGPCRALVAPEGSTVQLVV